MSTQATVLVIGGTGTTGSRVATLLSEQATSVRVGTRTPNHERPEQVGFDWSEPATHGPAVAGVDRVYLLAPLGVAEPGVTAPHDDDALIQTQSMSPATGQRHVSRISQPAASTSHQSHRSSVTPPDRGSCRRHAHVLRRPP